MKHVEWKPVVNQQNSECPINFIYVLFLGILMIYSSLLVVVHWTSVLVSSCELVPTTNTTMVNN